MKNDFKNALMGFFALLLILSSCCKPEAIGNVANTLRPQETNNWCWAATTQMLAQHFAISVTQCSLANHRFSMNNCCTPQNQGSNCPKNSACNKPGWLELDFAGLKFTETNTALSWDALKKQIFCAKKPMGYAYGTPGVVGHVLVIKGYITLNGTRYLALNDPWAPCSGQERFITYEEYENPPGTSTHWSTWYDIAKK
ncbi:papain-like cysteine protease family protein [Kaistella sp. PBT33-4]|uniref:papain-like cysteine protease family protein n=1 Tax=Kaistella sp. PBT33-4 TaxID=3032000 RepID=UPI0023D7F992|nr:papain-like cysteine protease family protein [Kaistella sp. PBT33-4]MDF0719371.1 papain-like cysteine protease family protein [Kaistella sp. PBT33-4]